MAGGGVSSICPWCWGPLHLYLRCNLCCMLSIGQCSEEEEENPAHSQDCPIRPLMVEAAALPSPQCVFESLTLLPPSNVMGVAEGMSAQPVASTEHTQQWEWPFQRFKAKKYRFVHLDQVLLHEAHKALVWGVGQVSDDLRRTFDPGGFAQLCLEAVCMHSFS